MKVGIALIVIICMLPIISADLFPTTSNTIIIGFGDGSGQSGVNIFVPDEIFNSSASTSNSTRFWITTSLGTLDDASPTQFNNVGGTLTIDETYLDTLYCQLTGCIMVGDINMSGNDIINAGNITANFFIGNGSLLTGIVHGIWESVGGISQLITAEDINLQNQNIQNVTNITLVNSIKDSDSDSRTYFDDEGAFVIEA